MIHVCDDYNNGFFQFQRNVVVHGLTEKLVVSPTDVLKLMEVGERRRQVGCTNMNERSSRSHTIFRMVRCFS